MDRISSPEQLNQYLRVTSPAVWVVLAAVILLLAGMLVWSSMTCIGSYVNGVGLVEDGKMTIDFQEDAAADRVEAGMTVNVGEVTFPISSVGRDEKGEIFALAEAPLADGEYQVRVTYRQTQVLKLLFNRGPA